MIILIHDEGVVSSYGGFMEYKLFLDMDDCLVESAKYIQEAVNNNTPYKTDTLSYLEQVIAGHEAIYDINAREIARAQALSQRPVLYGINHIGSNDIFKTSSSSSQISLDQVRNNHWYVEPLKKVENVINNTKWKREMFLEERDNFLECDNKKDVGDIDYSFIYQSDHLIDGVLPMVNDLKNDNRYSFIGILSHHNGGREETAKKKFVLESGICLPFFGLRFHLDKYTPNVRRERSSKALYVMQILNVNDLSNCVLVDDSIENLDEWKRHGGIAILYRPLSVDERLQGYNDYHQRDYPRITVMSASEIAMAINLTKGSSKVLKK